MLFLHQSDRCKEDEGDYCYKRMDVPLLDQLDHQQTFSYVQ